MPYEADVCQIFLACIYRAWMLQVHIHIYMYTISYYCMLTDMARYCCGWYILPCCVEEENTNQGTAPKVSWRPYSVRYTLI